MRGLHPSLRRLLAITVLLALALFAAALVNGVLRAGSQAIEGLRDARFELQQVQRRIRSSGEVSDSVIDREWAELSTLLSWQGPPEEGDARLQGSIAQIMRESGLELLQMRSAESERNGPLLSASLDASGSGSEAGLYQMLARIEGARPPLRIDRLVIRSGEAMNAADGEGARVEIEFRVTAFGAAGSGS